MGVNPRVARGNALGILQVVVWCFLGLGFRVVRWRAWRGVEGSGGLGCL